MREVLILLVVVAAIAIIWYLRQERARAAEQRRADDSRRISADAAKARPAAKGAGLFQQAAGTAVGLPYERAVDQLEELTADLASARRDAERSAERLANRAAETLDAIKAAAAAHGGAVPGDGTDRCPPHYPVKGTMTAMRYHVPSDPSYNQTVPEVCFQSAAAAQAAGFNESGDEAETRRDGLMSGDAVGEKSDLGASRDRPRATGAADRK